MRLCVRAASYRWSGLVCQLRSSRGEGTYIRLATWTRERTQSINASPGQLDKVKERYRSLGGELKQLYASPSARTPRRGWLG